MFRRPSLLETGARSSITSRSSILDSASGQAELMASEQSRYQFPQYPQSYTDFIPTFKLRGKQTTVMLADLWLVLEALIADEYLINAHTSFYSILNSLPDELIPVRITNNKDDRILVSPWYIFVDPDSNFTLRPFFQKAIIKSLEEDNHSYLNVISKHLEKISVSKGSSVPALRRPDRYKATYNFDVSEAQLLAAINRFLDSRYISLNQQQENLATLRKTVTEKENQDQSELLHLNASIDRKRAELFQLKRQFDDKKIKNSSQHKELKKENQRVSFVDKEAEAITELEENIAEKRTRNGEIQDQILQLEYRLRVIESDFNELKREEHHQKIAYEHEKQQYSKSSEITLWLAEKIEALRVELLQRAQKSIDVMTSPYDENTDYLTPTKNNSDRSLRSESADSFSENVREIAQLPIMQTTPAASSPRASSGKKLIRPATPPPPPRRGQPSFQPPPPLYPKTKVVDVVEGKSPGTFSPRHTPSRGSLHASGNRQDIKNSPAIQRVQAKLEEKASHSSSSQSSTVIQSPSWKPAPPPPPPPKNASTALSDHRLSLFTAIINPAGFSLKDAKQRDLAKKQPLQVGGIFSQVAQVMKDRRLILSDDDSVTSTNSFGSDKS